MWGKHGLQSVSFSNKLHVQSSQRNTLHPCSHELHMGCTTGELALSDELHTSPKNMWGKYGHQSVSFFFKQNYMYVNISRLTSNTPCCVHLKMILDKHILQQTIEWCEREARILVNTNTPVYKLLL